MQTYNLDTTLIEFGHKAHGPFHWTTRAAIEGVQIFGGIGSGKTSGSGQTIALKYLASGFGGLILTAKPDEKELWQKYCSLTGRTDDLVIIEPAGEHRFNFLEYESGSSAAGIPLTENIVQVLKTVIRASEEKSSGKTDDPFWETALDMLIFNVIDLCALAYGNVSVRHMYDIVLSAPKPHSEQNNKKDETDNESEKSNSVKEEPFFNKTFRAAKKNAFSQVDAWEATLSPSHLQELEESGLHEQALLEALPDARTFQTVHQFFFETLYNLNERTRSIIDFSFAGFLFRLMKEPVYSLFCQHSSTITPDDCLEGKIILLNIPVKLYQKVGRDCQIMFKYIWQRAMERRQIPLNDRPVFLWADEAQNFLHEHDAEYQATARSSRIATVYISQNLPNYYANMGGIKSEYRVKSFLGTLGTKIFHANADIETSKYSSELIGDAYEEDVTNTSTVAGNFSASKARSYKLVRMVRPEEFVSLKTGGPPNSFRVEGYIHLQGNSFPEKMNHRRVSFQQKNII